MAIPIVHFYNGAALSLITDGGKFTALTRLTKMPGRAYAVNQNIGIYVKTSALEGSRWQFTFPPDHQEAVRDLFNKYDSQTFIVMVCHTAGVCAITFGEYEAALSASYTTAQALVVERPTGGGFRVHGRGGNVRRVVPLNDFPNCLF